MGIKTVIDDILCFFNCHKYDDWKCRHKINNHQYKLIRRCCKCGKIDVYIGLVQKSIETNKISPYIYKD